MSGRPVRISIIANGRQARAELQQTGIAATGLGRTVATVAKSMGLAFAGIEIAHLGGELLHQAVQFQSATNLLVTAGGESRKAIGLVSDGILKLAGQTGTSTEHLAEGMYTVEKAGFRAANGLEVLKNSAEGAKAENVDLATMTGAVTSVMTSYHKEAGQSAQVVNELVAASGAAKTTMQLFAGSLASVLPTASAAGISFAEVGGAIATLTQHGTSADEATQELANTIRNLQAPNNIASQEMQQLGINVTNLSKNLGRRGLTGTLDLVVNAIGKSMGKSGLVMVNAFRKSQSAGADLQLMVKAMPKDLSDLSKGFLDGSVSMDDYRKAVKSMGAPQAAMGTQFLSLVKSSQGFSNALKSGNPTAQTFVGTLKKVLGGATGMNTALQLTGENMAGFRSRVEEIDKAAKGSGKTVSTWAATQKTAAVQIDKLKFSLQALGIKGATALLPLLTKGLVPITDWLNKNEPQIEQFGSNLVDDFKPIGAVVELVAKGFDALPGPIKSTAIEVGLLAVIMPRLNTAIASTTGSMAVQVGTLRMWGGALANAETRSTALGLAGLKLAAASKTAAGIGGMLALAQSSKIADTGMRTLATTASGALIGFSAAGPLGAAVGAGVGLIGSLYKAAHQSNDEFRKSQEAAAIAKQAISDLTGTVDQASGAYTKLTRATVSQKLQASGVFTQLAGSGLNSKQIVDAALGQQSALQKLIPVFDSYNRQIDLNKAKILALKGPYEAAAATDQTRAKAISDQIVALQNQNSAMQGAMDAFGGQARAAAGAADAIKAQNLATQGYVGTLKGLPRSVVTRIKQQGLNGSLTQVAALAKQYKLTPKQIVTLIKAEGIEPTKSAINSVASTMKSVASRASGYGSSAGSAYGSGFVGGISAWTGRAEFAAMAMAGAAHAAAMRALNARSPSRKMIQVGKWFSQGFAIGIRTDASKVLDAVDTLFGKVNKKQLPAIKKLVAQYTKGADGLRSIARQQADVNNRLDDAKQKLADAKQAWKDYAANVKAGVVAFADITELGKNSAGNATADGIVSGLRQRADAVAKYVATVQHLIGEHLNATALQQILDKGVDGGLQTALAIDQGGAGTIAQINALQAQIDKAAGSLGNSASHRMNDAGVAAAQGLVNGLLAQQKNLDKVAKALADALVKAVKKRLGIHSPSTVFRDLGQNTMAGLNIGLDSTIAQRSGQVLASSLVKGFGTPSLSANAGASAGLFAAAQQQSMQTLRVVLTADKRDALLAGRDVILDISAASSTGARQMA